MDRSMSSAFFQVIGVEDFGFLLGKLHQGIRSVRSFFRSFTAQTFEEDVEHRWGLARNYLEGGIREHLSSSETGR